MRFEVISAFVTGGMISILGTCLEYYRRGYKISFADVAENLDDYLAAVLLLFAGFFAVRARAFAPVFLVLAWAYCTSLMVSSFWRQIQDTVRGPIEPENTAIILGKLGILSVCHIAGALIPSSALIRPLTEFKSVSC